MINIAKIIALKNQLTELVAELQAGGKWMYIEYGDASEPSGSVMSHLRVRYMNTAGGIQFCLKTVRHHIEGSGLIYTPDAPEIVTHAMDAVLRYHRRTLRNEPITGRVTERKASADLSWFGVGISAALASGSIGQQVVAHRHAAIDVAFPDAITITLGE